MKTTLPPPDQPEAGVPLVLVVLVISISLLSLVSADRPVHQALDRRSTLWRWIVICKFIALRPTALSKRGKGQFSSADFSHTNKSTSRNRPRLLQLLLLSLSVLIPHTTIFIGVSSGDSYLIISNPFTTYEKFWLYSLGLCVGVLSVCFFRRSTNPPEEALDSAGLEIWEGYMDFHYSSDFNHSRDNIRAI